MIDGWDWLYGTGEPEPADRTVEQAFAACFRGGDGEVALGYLRRVFLDRRLPPSASDAELRHLEGQRTAVAHVLALVARGRIGIFSYD